LRIVALIQFVETAEEVVEAELLRCRRLDLPREETPDGVAAHDAVEQGDHLSRLPNVLALDRGEDQSFRSICVSVEAIVVAGRYGIGPPRVERVVVPGYVGGPCGGA